MFCFKNNTLKLTFPVNTNILSIDYSLPTLHERNVHVKTIKAVNGHMSRNNSKLNFCYKILML